MTLPEVKIEGRSGCILELNVFKDKVVVRKISSERKYNQRLKRQAEKQKQFSAGNFSIDKFKTPVIYNTNPYENDELFWLGMEYIPGESYGAFIEKCSIIELQNLAEVLISFIEMGIKHSEKVKISSDLIKNKIDDLKLRLIEKEISNAFLNKLLNNLKDSATDLNLPIGFCHGDLTFSNMIFNNNNIYLVDFLDSFIESPLMDIIKIRQDTKFHWTLFIDKNKDKLQTGKIIQAFRYLDKRIEEHFLQYDFYKENYNFFESLNLLRILPYLNDKQEIQFIIDCLNTKDE